MRLYRVLILGGIGLTLATGMAHAGTVPAAPQPGAPGAGPATEATKAPETSPLILSIRAHALGMVQESPISQDTRLPGLERMRAPTGEGTARMPSTTTEIGRGVYISVMPACIPGVDEPAFPPYRPAARRR